jgi:hypothetical protein
VRGKTGGETETHTVSQTKWIGGRGYLRRGKWRRDFCEWEGECVFVLFMCGYGGETK